MSVVNVALLGAGSMAARHARTVSRSGRARLAVVIDRDRVRAATLARRYSARCSIDPADALDCDAVIVAVATQAHLTVAEPFLRHGMPVLLEKPLADDLHDTKELIDLAKLFRAPLMCGFVERFNPAVRAVFELASGAPERITAIRHSPPPHRPHGGVVNDVLLHDLDLIHLFTRGQRSTRIDVTTGSTAHGAAETVECVVRFDGGATAELSASRISHHKVRTTTLVYPDLVLELDLLRQTITLGHRDGSTTSAWPQPGDSLTSQFEHFLELIDGRVDQEVERAGILPAHELADAIGRSST